MFERQYSLFPSVTFYKICDFEENIFIEAYAFCEGHDNHLACVH